MKAIMSSEKSTALELSNGQISQIILVNFITTIFMERAYIPGLMEGNMKASGEQTKCMEKELLFGLMVENISGNTPKIKSVVTANSSGQIVVVTEENG